MTPDEQQLLGQLGQIIHHYGTIKDGLKMYASCPEQLSEQATKIYFQLKNLHLALASEWS